MSTTMYSVREVQAPPPGHAPGPIHPPGHPPTSRYDHLHRPHASDPCTYMLSVLRDVLVCLCNAMVTRCSVLL